MELFWDGYEFDELPETPVDETTDGEVANEVQTAPLSKTYELKPIEESTNLVEMTGMLVSYTQKMSLLKQAYEEFMRERANLVEKLGMVYSSPEEDDQTYMMAYLVDRFLNKYERHVFSTMYKNRHQSIDWQSRLKKIIDGAPKEYVFACYTRNLPIMREAIYRGELLAKFSR
ncbi:MAG: hypothetical protein KatS3mg087_0433 [Patescibacteria group bacterium]|nr:MAG: hypothetical protein KatS3mg087_0433 [Patescibacteria group bacterium]